MGVGYDFNKDRRQDTNTGLIVIAIFIAMIFLVFGLFIGFGINNSNAYKNGYSDAKKDKSTTIVPGCCDHDSVQCELLTQQP